MGTSMVFAMVNFINLLIYHNIPILAVPIHYSSASDLLPQLCDHAEQDLVLYLLYQPVHSQPRSITRIFTHILRGQGWDVVCEICIKQLFSIKPGNSHHTAPCERSAKVKEFHQKLLIDFGNKHVKNSFYKLHSFYK